MAKKSAIISIATLLTLEQVNAKDLGVITVESTTIDNRFQSKFTEISTTATVESKEIELTHSENIKQILQSIPGLTTELQSGDSLKIHIRGVENQRYMGEKPGVAVVIDGVPVFERTGRVNIDLDNIESIKVIKGGASYLFGEDALSGAVVITTKRGVKYDNTFLSAEVGSFEYRRFLARQGFSSDNYIGHIQATQRESDEYHQDSGYNSKYLNGKFQYFIDDFSDITFGAEYSKREKDSHGTVRGVTQAKLNPESIDDGSGQNRDYTRLYDVELLKLFATYSKDLSDSQNLLFNIYQYSDETEFVSSPQRYDEYANEITSASAYNSFNEYEQIQRGLKSEFRDSSNTVATLIGVDIRDNEYENRVKYLVTHASRVECSYYPTKSCTPISINRAGEITQKDETQERVYALYGELKYALRDNLAITTNARFDKIDYDFEDILNSLNLDKSFNVGSYRVGLSYILDSQNSIYTNISTGFRTPTIEQLFAGDIDPTGSTMSNPDLEVEESLTYEIGYRGYQNIFDNRVNFNMALFQIDRDDYIMSSAGQYSKTERGVESQFQNIGGARNRGYELALNSDRERSFYVDLAYSFIDAKFTEYDNFYLGVGNPYTSDYKTKSYNLAGNRVPRVSKHNFNLRLNYNFNKNFLVTTELEAKSSYFADELNRVDIAGYEVFNLIGNYQKDFKEKSLYLFFRVNNLFDKFYYNSARGHSDSDYDGDFDAEDISISVNQGRSYSAGLSFKF